MRIRGPARLCVLLALAAIGLGVRPVRGDGKAADPRPAPPPSPLSALLESALTPAQRAERAFLEHLGWRFVSDASATTIRVAGGTPCRRPDLASAQAAGDLRIVFPAAPTTESVTRFAATLSEVADSIASRCAWQFRVAPAVERATRKLSETAARGTWKFPLLIFWPAPLFTMNPPESQWVRRAKVCFARGKPSAAIEAFYTESASTECYVGQTVASYAIEYELYGAAWFDEAFAPDEIAIGQVDDYHETPIGRSMVAPEDYPWRALLLKPSEAEDNPGAALGRLGPLAFPGLTGILMDQNGTGRSNQNLTFVSVSSAAAEALAKTGFGIVGDRTRELLALERAGRSRFVTGADLTACQERVNAILSDPVFSGIRVYIHPFGVVTLGEMVDKVRRRDRTAVEVILYAEAREDTFFQRYRQAWKARWAKAPGAR